MNKKLVTVVGFIIIAAITATYMYLGGLNKVEYTVESVSDYNLIGVPFVGDGDSKKIEEAYGEAKQYVLNDQYDGVLTLVHYNDSTLEEGQVKFFIGIKLNVGISDIPANYQRLTIPAKYSARASIEAHNSVMPSPGTIEESLREKAAEANLRLQDFTIEQYVSENLLMIDMPAK